MNYINPVAEAEDQVTFMVEVVRTVFEPLDNQTEATLDTGDLPTGTYACQVTWNYLGTLDNPDDDWTATSDPVEYVKTYTVTWVNYNGEELETLYRMIGR